MTIKLDQNACIGCGACASMCPDNFALNDEGKAEVISQDLSSGAEDTVAVCPVSAISID